MELDLFRFQKGKYCMDGPREFRHLLSQPITNEIPPDETQATNEKKAISNAYLIPPAQ